MPTFSNESSWRWSDLLGYAADNTLQLVVELKSRTVATGSASQWLRDVGHMRPELYALFVAPDFMALRLPAKQRQRLPHLVGFPHDALQEQLLAKLGGELDYGVDAATCLDAVIDTQRVPLYKLEHDALEQVVASWLASSLMVSSTELLTQPSQAWLVESGLHSVLHDGSVVPPNGPYAHAFAG